jgi:SAM-dependent methyltransferase
MRTDAIKLEESRLVKSGEDTFPELHERHRAFPAVFENRRHQRILDVASGVGYVARRIRDNYPAEIFCNDISPTALKALGKVNIPAVSYSIDSDRPCFPFTEGTFDAVIALATIEHLIYIDNFIAEINCILKQGGYLYLSAPNYAGLIYLLNIFLTGKTFHDPLAEDSRYEFYAHVRYFTYRTMADYVKRFNFTLDTVYLPLPKESSHYIALYKSSKGKALAFKYLMNMFYTLSPRWASEPILCFQKQSERVDVRKVRKVIL